MGAATASERAPHPARRAPRRAPAPPRHNDTDHAFYEYL